MHQNWIFLQSYCSELEDLIKGATVEQAFSNSTDELILVFKKTNQEYLGLKCLFLNDSLYLYLEKSPSNPSNKSQFWFQSLNGTSVNAVKNNGKDRSFYVELKNKNTIFFKLYGRMSNVLLFNKDGNVRELFRAKHKNDLSLEAPNTHYKVEKTILDLDLDKFLSLNRHIPPTIGSSLLAHFKNKTPSKEEIMEYIKSHTANWGLKENNYGWELDLFGTEYTSAIEVSNQLVKKHFSKFSFFALKEKLTTSITKEITKTKHHLKSLSIQEEKAKNRKSQKEIADIIMANLHNINKGQEEAILFDFYENKEITIKLKKNLSPQDFASKLYKKAKNQSKEVEIINSNTKNTLSKLDTLESNLAHILATNTIKELKKMVKPIKEKSSSSKTSKPYWERNIEGIPFWIGKGARQNDELLRLTHKEEWWFHAKDVAGSHCVAKTKKELSKNQLEKMSAIAAYYSKAKTQSITPVIYTRRKFVRKPRGFTPGKVIVEKESVILIEPDKGD